MRATLARLIDELFSAPFSIKTGIATLPSLPDPTKGGAITMLGQLHQFQLVLFAVRLNACTHNAVVLFAGRSIRGSASSTSIRADEKAEGRLIARSRQFVILQP